MKRVDGVEGYVVDVGWRSTRVRQLQLMNYDLPERRLRGHDSRDRTVELSVQRPGGGISVRQRRGTAWHAKPARREAGR